MVSLKSLLVAGLCIVATPAAFAGVNNSCRATLSVADARLLAEATPNSRAFVSNYGSKLTTTVTSQGSGSAVVQVQAQDKEHGRIDVGTYTVSLRTGRVMGDDMEPADDGQTAAVRSKLMARHCESR